MARSTFGDAIAQAKKTDTSGAANTPPDGKYTATITSGNVQPTSAGDNFRLGERFVIDSGPHVRSSAWNSQMFRPHDEMNVRIFRKMCEAQGIDVVAQLGHFDLGDPDEEPSTENPDPQRDHADKVKVLLEEVLKLSIGKRVQVVVHTKPGRDGVARTEVKFVNALPSDAPPSQLDAAREGAAQVASKMAAGPAGPKKPRPAI